MPKCALVLVLCAAANCWGQSQAPAPDQRFPGRVIAPRLEGSVNRILLVTAPPYEAKCDGVSDDRAAIQAAFDDALANGYSVQFPAGVCKTGTIVIKGQTFFGAGIGQTRILGQPGQDVFAVPDSAIHLVYAAYIHDLTIQVDSSVNAAATAVGGNNTFPNRISGTAGGTEPLANPPAPGPVTFGPGSGNCGGSISAGSSTFALPCSYFQSPPPYLVVGTPITIAGAGVNGSDLTTTIAGVVSNSQVTLAAPAQTTVTSARGAWGNPISAPWFFGNCGIAIPTTSGAAMATGLNGWTFRNLQIESTHGAPRGNYTCGIFIQAASNALRFENVDVMSLWGGIIEAPPASNNTSYFAWTPDTNSYINVNLKFNMIPMIWYNGSHRVVHGLNIYAGVAPFELGLFQFAQSLGSSHTAYPSATISQYYDECWTLNSGEHTRFSGIDVINGGSLSQCRGRPYINWLAGQSTVDAQIGSGGLHISGNQNTFTDTGLSPAEVIDMGLENSVLAGTFASDPNLQRRFYANRVPPQEPVGKLDGGFVLSGNSTTPYVSGSDLVTTCRDYRFSTARNSTARCVNDPQGTEVSKSYIQSIGTRGFGTGAVPIWSFLMVAGSRIPLTKVYVVTEGKCEGTSACTSQFTIVDTTNQNRPLAHCAITYGSAWTIQGGPSTNPACQVDLSSVPYGDVIGWSYSNFSGTPSAVDIGFVAFEPQNIDVINMMRSALLLSGTSVAIGGTLLAPGSCANGTAIVDGATADMVAEATPHQDPGDSFLWKAYVSSPGNVTVKVCNFATSPATPAPTTYSVRVIP